MTYRVQITRAAAKTIQALDKPIRRRVLTAIEGLATNPRPHGCVKLTGHDAWRIRVGDYRIVYEIHDAVLLIIVIDAGHRREIYRD
ncbi:hypothetical protein GCM10012275_64660 [Longimycelium tulufanense]|uniref:Plasmid stabilization protein n=1 Tax=Longimycelium tulufanense TaxID=907463 RepID=A0A8J3CJA1_9PSEU|nr:type II toxin-antitoxin system RelE/ParE family toxin [Longimycelium tulufanense]GGM84971.1 hypothetical protein GCM10012275_64660 [Longimycelium tulufanense]